MDLTFEQLPGAVTRLIDKLDSIEKLLLDKGIANPTKEDQWFDLNELCEYLPDKPAKATAYAWVNARTIPFHKGTKKLQFLKSEIDVWLKSGRRKTVSEIIANADSHLITKKGRK